jgi:hypothetical protein
MEMRTASWMSMIALFLYPIPHCYTQTDTSCTQFVLHHTSVYLIDILTYRIPTTDVV